MKGSARSRDRPPEPGDLVFFPETADLPIEWAVLERDPGRPGLVLVVPADTNPKAGTADVEVTAGSAAAPLTLRCGFGIWIGEARLSAARRNDILDPQDVSAARRVWKARERGEPVGSLLAEEVDADPEYQDWVEDVLVPARAALMVAPAVPIRRGPVFFGNPLALAASVLLMVSLGLTGGLFWQGQKLEDFASERTRTQEELRLEREKLAGELRQAEEVHRRELTATEQRAEEARQQDRERIAALERRLAESSRLETFLNIPFVGLAQRDPTRGELEEVKLPAEAHLFFLLLSMTDTRPFPSYRLEVASKETGRVVWTGGGLKASPFNEVSLVLPRDAFSPGDYLLHLYGLKNGKEELAGEYEVRIAHP